jgi:hypothetical protein
VQNLLMPKNGMASPAKWLCLNDKLKLQVIKKAAFAAFLITQAFVLGRFGTPTPCER